MNFLTDAQRICYQKVSEWLPSLCDRLNNPVNHEPIFSVQCGSATVLIEVRPFQKKESIIYIWSYVATDVPVSDDLLLYLLKQNDVFRFGGFSMADEGDIRFHVTLLGESCQQNELKLALAEVLESADLYDDQIVERWGGRRANDNLFDI